jgi:hypothetical protein
LFDPGEEIEAVQIEVRPAKKRIPYFKIRYICNYNNPGLRFMPTIHYNKQLLIAGIIFTLHNTEEAFGFRQFRFDENPLMHIPRNGEMTMAIVIITLLAWIAIGWIALQPQIKPKRFLLTTLVSVFLFNAFIPHILGAIYVGGYFPALVTAVILYLPYTYWMLPRLYNEFGDRRSFYITVGQGICIAIALTGFSQLAGYLIYRL